MRKMDVLGLTLASLSTGFILTNSLHLLHVSKVAGVSALAKTDESTSKVLATNWGA